MHIRSSGFIKENNDKTHQQEDAANDKPFYVDIFYGHHGPEKKPPTTAETVSTTAIVAPIASDPCAAVITPPTT